MRQGKSRGCVETFERRCWRDWLTLVDSGGENWDENLGEFVHFRAVFLFGCHSFLISHPGFEAEFARPDFLVIETYQFEVLSVNTGGEKEKESGN